MRTTRIKLFQKAMLNDLEREANKWLEANEKDIHDINDIKIITTGGDEGVEILMIQYTEKV